MNKNAHNKRIRERKARSHRKDRRQSKREMTRGGYKAGVRRRARSFLGGGKREAARREPSVRQIINKSIGEYRGIYSK